MKLKNILLIILVSMTLLSNTGSAATITTPVLFEIYANTTYITVYNQTADSFTVSTADHYLDILLNGTHLIFTTTTNMTLTDISYYSGVLNYTVNGNGNLTTNIIMTPTTLYNIYIDNVLTTTQTSNFEGNISFIYNGDGTQHNILIQASTQTPPLSGRLLNCGVIVNYSSTVMSIFGLILMIVGFGIVISLIKTSNYTIIISGILMIIIGFATLLLGNYILNALFGILC